MFSNITSAIRIAVTKCCAHKFDSKPFKHILQIMTTYCVKCRNHFETYSPVSYSAVSDMMETNMFVKECLQRCTSMHLRMELRK